MSVGEGGNLPCIQLIRIQSLTLNLVPYSPPAPLGMAPKPEKKKKEEVKSKEHEVILKILSDSVS